MAAKTEVPITGAVLAWAMSEAGLTEQQLADRLAVSRQVVRDWESEISRPGKTEFRKIVEAVRRPSAIFFMPAPPESASLPVSFRYSQGLGDHSLSPGAIREVRKAQRLQKVFAWILRDHDPPNRLPVYNWETADARESGEELRRSLQLPLEEHASWSNFSEAFRKWRTIYDDMGVLTFSLQLGTEDIRGFSVWDERAPLIGVNTAYIEGARIFTMAHELGHLVTRTDSACYDWFAPTNMSNPRLERWCEEFAAAFLLPRAELSGYVAYLFGVDASRPVKDFETVWKISRRLKISARALAISLTDADLAPKSLYDVVDQQAKKVDRPAGGGGGGLPVVQKRVNQYGVRVPGALLDAVSEGALGELDAADYLDMNLGDLQDLTDSIRGRQSGWTRQ